MIIQAYVWLLAHRPHLRSESGQDLIEYAMLGGLIAVALVAVGIIFTPALETMATNIGACIDFNSGTPCIT